MITVDGVEGSWDGQSETKISCILILSLLNIYLCKKKRTGSIGDAAQGLPLKCSAVHLGSSVS